MKRISLNCVSCDQHLELTVNNDDEFQQMMSKCAKYFDHLIPTSSSSLDINEEIWDTGNNDDGSLPFCEKCRPVMDNLLQLHQNLNKIQREIVKVGSTLAINVIVNNNDNSCQDEPHKKLPKKSDDTDSVDLKIQDSMKKLRSIIFNKFCPEIRLTDCRPSSVLKKRVEEDFSSLHPVQEMKQEQVDDVSRLYPVQEMKEGQDDDVVEVGPSRFNLTEDDDSLQESTPFYHNPIISSMTKLANQKKLTPTKTKPTTTTMLSFKRNFRGGFICCTCNHEEYEQSKIVQHILATHRPPPQKTKNEAESSSTNVKSRVGDRGRWSRLGDNYKWKVRMEPNGMLRCSYCGFLASQPGDMMKHIQAHIEREATHERRKIGTTPSIVGNVKNQNSTTTPPKSTKDDDMENFLNFILS